jgi:hypothetical protein
MGNEEGLAEIGQRWSGWAKILGTVIALIALLGGGSFLYNEVWQSKVLVYTILPNYDLGGRVFSGLIVENRGRVTLTEVQVILADLDTPIEALNIPGAHEPHEEVRGGIGQEELFIRMPRLSSGKSLPIYMLTANSISFNQDSLMVSSHETVGKASTDSRLGSSEPILMILWFVFGMAISTLWDIALGRRRSFLAIRNSSGGQ